MTDDGIELSESQLMILMRAYLEAGREEKRAKRAKEIAAGPIRDYLEKHGGQLYDGESGAVAILQPRKGTPELDTANLPDELLRWMADQHALKLDKAVYDALQGKAAEHLRVSDWISPGAGSTALVIREENQ